MNKNEALTDAELQPLGADSDLEKFWNLFNSVFGTQYNRTIAISVRS
ncbi:MULTISPECIES: hypothetical protein [unclassified Nostoc]|nr:hypothetical protein [Nostoc sp. S13]MDF5739428.1 hypothetical protein [Nostoc sp. S13]